MRRCGRRRFTSKACESFSHLIILGPRSCKEKGKIMTEAKQELKIGDEMADGTVYAGISPNTHRPMYTTQADAIPVKRWWERAGRLTFTFKQAHEQAQMLNKRVLAGHTDWRVPTAHELKILFENRAAIGGFSSKNDYWSSICGKDLGLVKRFRDGMSVQEWKDD